MRNINVHLHSQFNLYDFIYLQNNDTSVEVVGDLSKTCPNCVFLTSQIHSLKQEIEGLKKRFSCKSSIDKVVSGNVTFVVRFLMP